MFGSNRPPRPNRPAPVWVAPTAGGTPAPSPAPSPTPAPTGPIPNIAPGVGWTGAVNSVPLPGSGWTMSGARGDGIARPALDILTEKGELIVDGNDLIIGVHSFAGNLGGPVALTMDLYIEGATFTIPRNTYTYADANGNLRTITGYFARLKHSSFAQNGYANVYWRATPTGDVSQGIAVIGPMRYQRVTAFTGYDYDVQVGAGLTANGTTIFNTQGAAMTYLHTQGAINPRITHMESGTLLWTENAVEHNPATCGYLTITHAPGVVVVFRQTNVLNPDIGLFRPNWAGIRFRGAGIRFDKLYIGTYYADHYKGLLYDGCKQFFERRPRSH
jgi:hypothetical protein